MSYPSVQNHSHNGSPESQQHQLQPHPLPPPSYQSTFSHSSNSDPNPHHQHTYHHNNHQEHHQGSNGGGGGKIVYANVYQRLTIGTRDLNDPTASSCRVKTEENRIDLLNYHAGAGGRGLQLQQHMVPISPPSTPENHLQVIFTILLFMIIPIF